MRPTQRMDLVDQLGRELQRRFTFREVDEFLSACGIKPPTGYNGPNSKWAYAKTALKDVADSVLIQIAAELEMSPIAAGDVLPMPPRNWQSVPRFRVFISLISKNRYW